MVFRTLRHGNARSKGVLGGKHGSCPNCSGCYEFRNTRNQVRDVFRYSGLSAVFCIATSCYSR